MAQQPPRLSSPKSRCQEVQHPTTLDKAEEDVAMVVAAETMPDVHLPESTPEQLSNRRLYLCFCEDTMLLP
jgi:hypothetical protein